MIDGNRDPRFHLRVIETTCASHMCAMISEKGARMSDRDKENTFTSKHFSCAQQNIERKLQKNFILTKTSN